MSCAHQSFRSRPPSARADGLRPNPGRSDPHSIVDKVVFRQYIPLNIFRISSFSMLRPKDPIRPDLFNVLSKQAGFTRDEYDFYCSLLKKRVVEKREHDLQA